MSGKIGLSRKNEDLREEFVSLVEPLIKWLNDTQHPHMEILVDSTGAQMVGGIFGHYTEKFLKD